MAKMSSKSRLWIVLFAVLVVQIFYAYLFYKREDGIASSNKERVSLDRANTMDITVGGIGYTFIRIPASSFYMGATPEQEYDDPRFANNAQPVRHVHLSEYWVGQTEVTRGLWNAVVPDSMQRRFRRLDYPITSVSWEDCNIFLERLNMMFDTEELEFRLPTEAEWEFAARGGDLSHGYRYSGSNRLDDVAQHHGNSFNAKGERSLSSVYRHGANELGLFGMTGNAAEWCLDGFVNNDATDTINPYKPPVHQTDAAPFPPSDYTLRGGSYRSKGDFLLVSASYTHREVDDETGFRIVLALPRALLEDYQIERARQAEWEYERQHLTCDVECILGEVPCEEVLQKYNVYPEEAWYIGMGGLVTVSYDVSEDGYIENVKAIAFKQESPYLYSEATTEQKRAAINALKRAAENAIRHLPRHHPAMQDGKPIRTTRQWSIRYVYQ